MQKNKKVPKRDNTTKYGEFVCSAFKWLPIDKQKEQAENLADMTKNSKDKDN